MKRISIIIMAIFFAFAGCKKKATDVNVELVSVDNEITTIGSTQAYFECEFGYINEITKALLVYSEDNDLKYAQTVMLNWKDGKWEAQVSYLKKKTTYYYMYEFYNGYNMMQTSISSFTTTEQQDKPTVETVTVTNILMTSATVEGHVLNDGGSFVSERGICYSIYENPTITDTVRYAGTGIGRFYCNMTNLTNATTYYVRAFAKNDEGYSFGDVLTLRTIEHPIPPSVTTDEVSDITVSTAVCGGNVLNDGCAEVTERGICYATHREPTIFDYKVVGGEGVGLFQCRMSGLETLTTYYVRAYAINSEGVGYGNEVNFETADETFLPEVITHEVTEYNHFYAIGVGEVIANGGLDIIERGICWSTHQNPTTNDNKLTAGTGMGEYSCRMSYLYGNTTYYVRAFAANEVGMTYGNEVTFTTSPHPNTAPPGSIPSLFSISNTQQVFISQGNLQYQATTGRWRFAEHQYDFVGGTDFWSSEETGNVYENGVKCSNNNVSQTYSGWIDLFGWATSGWNNNNHYYHPWDTESTGWVVDGYGYGYWDGEYARYDMLGDYANSDWGVYNPISNGGNEAGIWRTMTSGEWSYLVNSRQDATYKRSLATVNGVKGFVLLPDAWILPEGVNFYANVSDYETNNYDTSHWAIMENAGAVFFPTTGYRYYDGGVIHYYNSNDYPYIDYWSSNCSSSSNYYSNESAGCAELPSCPYCSMTRFYGAGVRLVQNY